MALMKNNRGRVISALARAKDKVIDKTSDALSLPKRAYYDEKSRQSDIKYKNYKMANDMKGRDDGGINKGNPSDLFKIRSQMKAEEAALKMKRK